jgi:hypothetical protein
MLEYAIVSLPLNEYGAVKYKSIFDFKILVYQQRSSRFDLLILATLCVEPSSSAEVSCFPVQPDCIGPSSAVLICPEKK